MTLKKLIKRIVNILLKTCVVVKPNKSEGKIIEFIGPSGVGKSTLYKLTKDRLSCKWNSINTLNHCKTSPIHDQTVKLHWELLKSKILAVETIKTSSRAKLGLVNYFTTILTNNIKILGVKNSAGFVLEEGLCHNFFDELNALKSDELSILLKNRNLICVLPRHIDTVVSQIQKRTRETGQTVFHHSGMSDEDLNTLTKATVEGMVKFISRVNTLKIPICQLYIEDGIDINCNNILDFEKTIN